MSAPPPEKLDYASRSTARNRRPGVWAPIIGVAAGVVLSFSGYGLFCVGWAIGFGVGMLCAYLAPSNPVLYGFVANVIAVITCLISMLAIAAASGRPIDLLIRGAVPTLGIALVILCVP